MARKKPCIPEVKIIDIADKGMAVGKSPEGEIVFVKDLVVPGDTITFQTVRKKKGVKVGFAKEIVELSEDRVDPFCQHFGVCGGCKWQNLSYHAQLRYKQKQVEDAILRIAKDDPSKVEPIVPCSSTRQYRNKLEFTFSAARWLTEEEISSGKDIPERRALGFHVSGAFDKVLDIQSCHLMDPLADRIRNFVRQFALTKNLSFYHIRENKGFLRNLIIRNSTLGQWMVTIVFGENLHQDIHSLFSHLIDAFPSVSSWNYMINTKRNSSIFDLEVHNVSGKPCIDEKLGEVTYEISPKSFFQTNPSQAVQLYTIAREMAAFTGDDIVYDLYTGTGSIALFCASHIRHVVGIEEVPEAIDDARKNAAKNGIANATFLVGDVKNVLHPQFHASHGKPDVIITDPPRAGMHPDVVQTILSLKAPRVVYISCNPSTQARDISLLKEEYDLLKVVPVDMFPHTSHIESVALLQRKLEG